MRVFVAKKMTFPNFCVFFRGGGEGESPLLLRKRTDLAALRKLNTVSCNDSEKLRYATHLLCGPAIAWWDNIVAIHPPGRIFTWEEFKKKFRESNVPESIMELKRREFENLAQNDKSIMKYVK
jgi:hypothetical protein